MHVTVDMAFTTPNMGLKVWNLLSDPYDHDQLAGNWVKLDRHDHGVNGGQQISTAGLADGAVTGVKIAANSILGSNIQDSGITTVKIADGAVTTAKIGDGQVTSAKIADLSVANVDLAGGIDDTKIAPAPRGEVVPTNSTIGVTTTNLTWGTEFNSSEGTTGVDIFSRNPNQISPTKIGIWVISCHLFFDSADASRTLRLKIPGTNQYIAQGWQGNSGPGAGSYMGLTWIGYEDFNGDTYVLELGNNVSTNILNSSTRRSRITAAFLGA